MKYLNYIKENYKRPVIVMSILALGGVALASGTPNAKVLQLEALLVEQDNTLKGIEEQVNKLSLEKENILKENCLTIKELARTKVSLLFDGSRPLQGTEDVDALLEKSQWECAENVSEPEDVDTKPNFDPSESPGLEAFLEKNGADFVKDGSDIFRKVGVENGIKPEVLVCIAQADSSLGKHLKSANNIGNVGNNDRGNVVAYPTLESGIQAMGKVLNNQYLGHYNTIGQLSRGGGNKTGSIYASSPYNWNKNVKLCLRNIYNDQTIDESFNFRINYEL